MSFRNLIKMPLNEKRTMLYHVTLYWCNIVFFVTRFVSSAIVTTAHCQEDSAWEEGEQAKWPRWDAHPPGGHPWRQQADQATHQGWRWRQRQRLRRYVNDHQIRRSYMARCIQSHHWTDAWFVDSSVAFVVVTVHVSGLSQSPWPPGTGVVSYWCHWLRALHSRRDALLLTC